MPELTSDRYYLESLRRAGESLGSPYSPIGIHHRHLNDFVQDQVNVLPANSRILDGGCGLSIWVTDASRKNYDLQSMDVEERAISFCRKHYNDRRYIVGDLYTIPLPDQSMDAIVLREVIEHLREPERALREIKRVLKHGGRLVLTTPNYSSPLLFLVENIYNRFFSEMKPYLDEVHPSKFKYGQLRQLLEQHFILHEYGTIDFLNIKAVVEKTAA